MRANSKYLLILTIFLWLKKLAMSSGITDTELDTTGPTINEESAYRYTSIFQVSSSALSCLNAIKSKPSQFCLLTNGLF
jgi:hypothetical protein